jgi:hypothetical protein
MRRIAPACFITAMLLFGCATRQPARTEASPDKPRSPSLAIPPPNGQPVDVKGVSELVDTFLDLCLNVFPDDDAVAAKAKAAGHAPLSDEQVRQFLHNDPGRGWVVRRDDMVLAVTIELPPFHSCAVRTMVEIEPDIAMVTALAAGGWGLKQVPVETLVPGPSQTLPGDGLAQTAYQFLMLGPDNRPVELVGAYLTRYSSKEAVEVRLVRMRGNNPR